MNMGNSYQFNGTTTQPVAHHASLRNSDSESKVHNQVDGAADSYKHGMPFKTNGGTQLHHARSTHHRQHENQQHRQAPVNTTSHAPPRQQNPIPVGNAVIDLLPYCTAGAPLRQDQIIALSDIVGSLKELALLALGASAGDAVSGDKLTGAVGQETASDIVAFFADELEVE